MRTRGSRTLFSAPTSVTGARVDVREEDGVRTLELDGNCQSDVMLLPDGGLSMAQPLELVKIMSLLSLGWVSGTDKSAPPPRLLLLGLGGGSIARVLSAALPPAGCVHSVELEPEVLQAAVDYFGLTLVAGRCTAEAGDAAKFLRGAAAAAAAGDGRGGEPPVYDVILLDAFTAEGLSASTQQKSTLDDAAASLSPRGLLLINLHTGDTDDPDYYVARRVLRGLCDRFESVYSVLCTSTQNLIAVCHQGDFLDAAAWHTLLASQLARPEVSEACADFSLEDTMSHFDFVGGRGHEPMSDDDENEEVRLGLAPRER